MPTDEQEAFRRAVLDTIVPSDNISSIADIFDHPQEDAKPARRSILNVKQRDLLFFDEKLTVHVVLQLPTLPENTLKALLARLDVRVDVWALDTHSIDGVSEGTSNSKDLVYSVPVEKTDDPVILVKGDDKDDQGDVSVLVLWETSVILNRPRIRFQTPAISIVASATLLPDSKNGTIPSEDYLPSFQPLEHNIFEPLKNVKGFEDNRPYLAASRLERVLPHMPTEAKSLTIQGIVPMAIPIIPAVSARTRFTRMPTPSGSFDTIVSLDFEVTPFVRLQVLLEQVAVSMLSCKVVTLMPIELPLKCSSKDCITFMYKLYPNQRLTSPALPATPQASNTGALDITIQARIQVSSICVSTINIAWSTNVDFSQALNPSFGPPSQPINRQKRPSHLPFAQQPATTPIPTLTTSNLDAGLTITITAPSTPVTVNIPFTWTIFVRNASSTAAKLALIPLPRIPRATTNRDAYTRRHAPKSSTASFHPSECRHTRSNEDKDLDIAQAVCDENIVYALQHSHGVEKNTEILSLTAELRIGPLPSGCVHESVVRMVALRQGALKVEALRVVDLTRDGEEGVGLITDVRDLPDVIAVEQEDSEVDV